VLELLPSPVMVKALKAVLPRDTNKVDPFNSHQSATNLALKFLVNTKLPPVVSNNFKNIAIAIFNTLATLLRLTARQTRYNGAPPQQKYEH